MVQSHAKVVWSFVALAAVVALFFAFSGNDASVTGNVVSDGSEVVKIGFMGPLTGDAASYGQSIKRGVDLALKDSGLENVEIIYEDSGCEGKQAVNAANKLISVDGVLAIVGEVCSGATLAAAPIAEQNGVVLISASSTSPALSESGEYIFRTVPSDALQGAFGAELVYDTGHRRLAILYGNEEYGLGFNRVLSESFESLGGEVVAAETFEKGTSDVRSQLTKIKASNPDAIYIVSNSPDSAVAALRQLEELGIEAEVYGSEGLRGPEVSATPQAEGLILTSVSSGTSEFAEKHRAKYGEEPGPFAAQAYDAFSALAVSLKSGARDGMELRDRVSELSFDGASGTIVFDDNGDVAGNYDVFQVRGREFVSL